VRALTLDYKTKYGFDALLARRKEPIKDDKHRHLLNVPEDAALGPYTYNAHSLLRL